MIKKLFVILLSLVLLSGTVVFAQEVINQGTDTPEVNVTSEQAQILDETLKEEPPEWVKEMQAAKLEWKAEKLALKAENPEGQPEWANGKAKADEKEDWREDEDTNQGPPPWANEKARTEQKQEWRAIQGEKVGPPDWAKDKTDKILKQAMRENKGDDDGPPPWAPAKGRNK